MTSDTDALEVDAILGLLHGMQAPDERDPDEGLRERKKRQVRQRISNVATAMFLSQGFDNVTVAQIATAAEVSEQTVFNYFATKESMFFDRTEPLIETLADLLRQRGSTSLVDLVVQAMAQEMHAGRWEALGEASQLHLMRRFADVATGSPTLVAARYAELPHFIEGVSDALAQRIGASPGDPEVQLATFVVAGLVQVGLQSTFRRVHEVRSVAALDDGVRRDIEAAATLAEPTLAAFDAMD